MEVIGVGNELLEGLEIFRVNFFVFLMMGLVVSITPCSAALIHESNASGDDGVEERALGSINVELNEIQSCTSSLNSSLDYVTRP